MKVSIAIPARLNSSRLPEKLLLDLAGSPVLWHTWKRAISIPNIEEVVILADHPKLLKRAEAFGAKVWSTEECASGTERIAVVAEHFSGDFIINLQGDEPFIAVDLIERMIAHAETKSYEIFTAAYPILDLKTLENSNCVKLALSHQEEALYFSRSPIPFIRDIEKKQWLEHHTFWGHIGLYGYRKEFLQHLHTLPQSPLAAAEKLEQLQFLEAGKKMSVLKAEKPSLGIDTWEDLEIARSLFSSSINPSERS